MRNTEKKALQNKIDKMSYTTMLGIWRNTPISTCSPYFTGETGNYFKSEMLRKKAELSPMARVQASKQIGW